MQWNDVRISRDDGKTLYVKEFGTGSRPASILLHGLGDCGSVWESVLPALAECSRLLVIDFRGHGQSAWAAKDNYQVKNYLQDILKAAETLCPGDFALVGHSLGGEIALHIAATFPDHVTRLVMVDFSPDCDAGTTQALADALRENLQVYQTAGDYASWIMRSRPLTSDETARRLANAVLRRCQGGFAVTTDPAVVRTALERNDFESTWEKLHQVRCPTLIVRGNGSAVLKTPVALKMAAALPNARIQVVAPAGHAVMTDNPEGFSAAVCPFLFGGS
jgi:pimeloyl-ACP methyl ester carboxylesterase